MRRPPAAIASEERRLSWLRGRRTHLSACLIAAVTLVVGACGGSSSDGAVAVVVDNGSLTVVAVSDCPPCDATSSSRAYGNFLFVSTFGANIGQSLVSICGFRFVGGLTGIGGQPLQVIGCGGGVELAFRSSTFSAFAIRSGYLGTFGNGIRIGDPLEVVLASVPGFVQVDPFTFVLDDGNVRLEANFDANFRLQELVVGRGFLR